MGFQYYFYEFIKTISIIPMNYNKMYLTVTNQNWFYILSVTEINQVEKSYRIDKIRL